MATDASVRQQLGSPGLTTKETNPTETKVSQLEVTVWVNEQIVRLQITATQSVSIYTYSSSQ